MNLIFFDFHNVHNSNPANGNTELFNMVAHFSLYWKEELPINWFKLNYYFIKKIKYVFAILNLIMVVIKN